MPTPWATPQAFSMSAMCLPERAKAAGGDWEGLVAVKGVWAGTVQTSGGGRGAE